MTCSIRRCSPATMSSARSPAASDSQGLTAAHARRGSRAPCAGPCRPSVLHFRARPPLNPQPPVSLPLGVLRIDAYRTSKALPELPSRPTRSATA
jgi:hypothetical protein